VPDLRFSVSGARAVSHAMAPLVVLALRLDASEPVHGVLLRCQIQIDAPRRPYAVAEEAGLQDLFGDKSRWGTTLKPLLWTTISANVPAFSRETEFGLEVPCSTDLCVAAAKYFHALQSGEVPLLLLFSGTVFYARPDGALQAAPISWSREARFSLPLQVLRDAAEACFPNSGFVSLQRETLDKLHRYKTRAGFQTFEQAVEALLSSAR
jgi:hypothetical protein